MCVQVAFGGWMDALAVLQQVLVCVKALYAHMSLRLCVCCVQENGIGRKRKRPVSSASAKKGRTSPPVNRLKSAKVAALNIRNRQEELKHQLAAIDGEDTSSAQAKPADVVMADADGSNNNSYADEPQHKDGGDSSSDSSSSSSDSSDSDSESDSDSDSDGEAPIQRVGLAI